MVGLMKFTEEESVFVEQLKRVRKLIAQLQVEEATQTDRILTILRGHQAQKAHTHDNTILIMKYIADSKEGILLEDMQP